MSESNPTEPTSSAPESVKTPPTRKRKKWPWVIGVVVLLLALLLLLAPTIASTGAVKSMVVSKINNSLNGRLDIADWSIGWTSGVTINSIKIDDEQGKRVAEIGSVRLPVSLIGAARGNYDLGEVVIDKPNLVNLQVYEDGSTNLDALVKKTTDQKTESKPKESGGTSKLPDVKGRITINEFRAAVNAVGAPPINVDPSTFVITIPSINSPIENDGKLVYRVGDAPASSVSISGAVDVIENNEVQIDKLTADQKIEVRNADLAAAAPFLRKSDPTMALTGIASGDLAIKAIGLQSAGVDGQLIVDNFSASGAALKGDTLKSSKVVIPIKVSTSAVGDDARIKIETVKVETDQLVLDVSGEVNKRALTNLAAQKAPGSVGELVVAVATKDLSSLVNQLRNTLALQKDVAINSGSLTAKVDLNLAPDRLSVKQYLDVDAAGMSGDKTIKLDKVHLDSAIAALEVDGNLRDLRDITINLASPFATAAGGGKSIADVRINGDIDLAKLHQQAAQFADLGALDFTGNGKFEVTSTGDLAAAGGKADVTSKVTLTNVIVRGLKEKADLNQPWLELVATAQLLRGQTDFIEQVPAAMVTLKTGDPQSPVVDLLAKAEKITLKTSDVEKFEQALNVPNLAVAQQQFAAFLPGTLRITGGSLASSATGSYQNRSLAFDQKAQLRGVSAQKMVLNGPAITILRDESQDIAATGTVTQGDVMTANLTALSASSSNKLFTIQKAGQGPLVIQKKGPAIGGNGELRIGSDLKPVMDLVTALGGEPVDPKAAGQLNSGVLDATLKLEATDAGTTINLAGAIDNLGVTTLQQPIANEKIALALDARTSRDFLTISDIAATIDSAFAKTTITSAELVRQGSTFEQLKRAKVQIIIPDINKTILVAQEFGPPAAPTTQPALQIAGGAVVNLDIARDGNTTRVNIPEIAASNVSIACGNRSFRFDKNIALKLAANLDATDKVSRVEVKELSGDLGGLATLAMAQPIVSDLTANPPSASGRISLTGAIEPLTRLLSVIQDADPMPYTGDYVVAQTVATDASGIKLTGDATINKLVVLQDGKPAFTEDKLVLANDLVADTSAKTANINSISLTMPSSQAAGLLLKGQVQDWESQRKLNNVTCDLSYDLAKLWPMVKPMLAPETQEQLKDLKIAGQFKRTFNFGGGYPATPPVGTKPIKTLTADGALAIQLLDTSGITINDLEVPITVTGGQLTTLYANKPKTERAAKPAKFNGGTLDVNSILVDLNGDEPRLSIGKNQKLVAGASINSLLGDTMGKYVNPVFANSKRAQGLLDITVEQCDKLALGEKLKSPQSGSAKVVFSLTEMDVANPVGQLLLGPIFKAFGNAAVGQESETFQGQIKDATIIIAEGRTTQDVTMMLVDPGAATKLAPGQKPPPPVYMPLSFKGNINLIDLSQQLNVNMSQKYVSSFIPGGSADKILNETFPSGIPIVMKGTTIKPQVDVGNILMKIVEGQAKSRLGDVIPGIPGITAPASGQPGEKPADPIGGLLNQLGGKKKEDKPKESTPAPASSPKKKKK